MIKIILLICLFPCVLNAQYTTERIFFDNLATNDTLYSKPDTDSLFRRVNSVYIFAMKTGFKKIMDATGINGLNTAIPTALGYTPANASHGHTYGEITGTPTIPTNTNELVNGAGFITIASVTAAAVGLGNANNTSDANKPISTATQTALDGKQATLVSATNIKTVGGVSLLGSGDVPTGGGATRVFLPSDVINNNGVANTIADITGLSFPVSASVTYSFKFFIVYSAAATTTGSRFAINGPATTFMNYTSQYTLTATSITNNAGLSAYNLPAASNASSLTTNNIAIIEGIIRPSASGNVIARFASEILSSAITAVASGRSYVEYQAIN